MSLSQFIESLDALAKDANEASSSVEDVKALEELRVRFTGAKNGQLKTIQKSMGSLAPEERPAAGMRYNEVKEAVQAALDQAAARIGIGSLQDIKQATRVAGPQHDPTLPGQRPLMGHLHPITQTIENLKEIMGDWDSVQPKVQKSKTHGTTLWH